MLELLLLLLLLPDQTPKPVWFHRDQLPVMGCCDSLPYYLPLSHNPPYTPRHTSIYMPKVLVRLELGFAQYQHLHPALHQPSAPTPSALSSFSVPGIGFGCHHACLSHSAKPMPAPYLS